MAHLGILLTVMGLLLGVISISMTFGLARKIPLPYLRLHNIVFILFNYQLFMGLAFNYFNFNILSSSTISTALTVRQLYHFHLSLVNIVNVFFIILLIHEVYREKWAKQGRRVFFSIYVSLITLQGFFSLFSITLHRLPLYIFMVLIIFFSSDLVVVIFTSWSYLRFSGKTGKAKRARATFSTIVILFFFLSSILGFLQAFRHLSTEIYVTAISIIAIALNTIPLLWIKPFIRVLYPQSRLEPTDSAGLEQRYRKYGITNREREIIDLIRQGKSNREIEDHLFISIQTVKDHIHSIYRKTGVKNRVQLSNLFSGNSLL